VLGRLTVEHDDLVSQVGSHDEIVLHNERSSLRRHDPTLNDLSADDALFGVQVRRGLVDKVDITRLSQGEHNSNALQFTTRQVLNVLIEQGHNA